MAVEFWVGDANVEDPAVLLVNLEEGQVLEILTKPSLEVICAQDRVLCNDLMKQIRNIFECASNHCVKVADLVDEGHRNLLALEPADRRCDNRSHGATANDLWQEILLPESLDDAVVILAEACATTKEESISSLNFLDLPKVFKFLLLA